MARVYLDESVLYLHRGADSVLDPGARLAVEMLEGDGHEVLIVRDQDSPKGLDAWVSQLPNTSEACPGESREHRSWYIVGDRACCGSRNGGLTTVLVGGGIPNHLVGGHCDNEVADLFTAALSVIAAGSSSPAADTSSSPAPGGNAAWAQRR